MGRGSSIQGASVAAAALCAAALLGAPGAFADDGFVPREVAPPVPPDQAGNPQPITIDVQQIPPVPPYVEVDVPGYVKPKPCKAKGRGKGATSAKRKSCAKRKNRNARVGKAR